MGSLEAFESLRPGVQKYGDVSQSEPDTKLAQAASPPHVRKVSDFPHLEFLHFEVWERYLLQFFEFLLPSPQRGRRGWGVRGSAL
jgi:hypothetical protein